MKTSLLAALFFTAASGRGTATAEEAQAACRRELEEGRAEEALKRCREAQEVARRTGDRKAEAVALHVAGEARLALNQGPSAIEDFDQALAARRSAKDLEGEAETLGKIGEACYALSRYDRAQESFAQALRIQRRRKDRKAEGELLNNMGAVQDDLSHYDRALEYYQQALAIRRQVEDAEGEGSTLNNLGVTSTELGRYEEALRYYEPALDIRRRIGDRRGEGETLANVGGVHNRLGQHEKAIDQYTAALAIFRDLKNRRAEGIALSSIGLAHLRLKRFDKALEFFEQALAISREVKSRTDQATCLTNIGVAHRQLGAHEKALGHFQAALSIRREVRDRQGEGRTLVAVGIAHRQLARYPDALGTQAQALAIAREVKDPEAHATALQELTVTHKAMGQPGVASFFGKQSVNVFQEIRENIRGLNPEARKSFVASKASGYRMLADLLLEQGRLPEAQQVLDLAKEDEFRSHLLLDAADARQAPGRVTLTPREAELVARLESLSRSLAALGQEREAFRTKKEPTPGDAQQLAAVEARLVEERGAFADFVASLAKSFPASGGAADRLEDIPEARELAGQLRTLGSGAVGLYTLVARDRYRVMLVTPEGRRLREHAIPREELAKQVLNLREALQDPARDPRPQARALYRVLLGPIEADLAAAGAATLLWSLDGVLRYVPIAALHDGERYLVERYRTVSMTTAQTGRLTDRPARQWTAWGFGTSMATPGFKALPGVRDELRAIVRTLDGPRGVLPGEAMLDGAFTREALLAALKRRRRPVVHIASHFEFRPGAPAESFLVLGDGKRLTLREVAQQPPLFEGVDVLSLSACDTAIASGEEGGREVEGFAMLAQKQGAKAVLATLWSVEDQSTRHLMADFYRRHRDDPTMSKAEALRQAQLSLLQGKERASPTLALRSASPVPREGDPSGALAREPSAPYAHPYYWAPFVLIGNPR